MKSLFIDVLNLSITASWIIIAVIFFRFTFKKLPRWCICIMWAIVGIRLVLPFSLESVLSLIPSKTTISISTQGNNIPQINTGISVVDKTVKPIIEKHYTGLPETTNSLLEEALYILSTIWLCGIIIMILYLLTTYIILHRKIRFSTPLYDNIRQSEYVTSPFVLGVFKPKIYVSYTVDQASLNYIISHEKSHIKRCDHLTKPLAFLILSIYWFNPFIWVAYILLCRDIELSCDERVITNFNKEEKQQYSAALLQNGSKHKIISACPIAFGEIGIKERVNHVMHYKKPAFFIILSCLLLCTVVGIVFLTYKKSITDINDNNASYETLEGSTYNKSSILNDNPAISDCNTIRISYSGGLAEVMIQDQSSISSIIKLMETIPRKECGTTQGLYGPDFTLHFLKNSNILLSLTLWGENNYSIANNSNGSDSSLMEADISKLYSILYEIFEKAYEGKRLTVHSGETSIEPYEILLCTTECQNLSKNHYHSDIAINALLSGKINESAIPSIKIKKDDYEFETHFRTSSANISIYKIENGKIISQYSNNPISLFLTEPGEYYAISYLIISAPYSTATSQTYNTNSNTHYEYLFKIIIE